MLAAIAGAVAASQSGPDVQAGIPAEVVAAIAGAIACMDAPEGVKYTLRAVRRAGIGGRSAWASAGVAANTEPF